MKNIRLSFVAILAIAGLFTSCKKDENRIYTTGGTPPVITANTSNARLVPGEETNETIKFNWTNPNYYFTTGISSHDVNYALEFDTLGANFKSANKNVVTVAKDLTRAFTQLELNSILGNNMKLPVGRSYNVEARIVSTLANSSVPLNSNTWRFTAVPFTPPPKVEPPAAGNLWVTGNAFASNWANPLPNPYDMSQKFTKLSNTLYELTVPMIPGGAYKLIQTQGDWSTQYKFLVGDALAGTFEKRDADPGFPAPTVAGTYKLRFDFQAGTFTATKQ
ncbi:MAG: SusE domain-containing protein [Bacteroidota bacterium]